MRSAMLHWLTWLHLMALIRALRFSAKLPLDPSSKSSSSRYRRIWNQIDIGRMRSAFLHFQRLPIDTGVLQLDKHFIPLKLQGGTHLPTMFCPFYWCGRHAYLLSVHLATSSCQRKINNLV
uniref:Secreted protein n=1 Tax=Salix viminalis TaxID=40686 RepID=A0A6N2KK65_SALVM